MASFLLSRLLLPFFFLCNILPSHALGSAPAGFSAGLIHRDSLVSPLRAAVSKPYSRVHAAIHRSRDRAKYVNKVVSSSRSREVNFSSVITTATFEYLMRFQLGTPVREAFAIPDTGSDLIWVQCKPCPGCSGPSYSLFDPNLSSTYKSVPCKTKSCSWLRYNSCDMKSSCRYNYSYADGTGVSGLLSTETLIFPSVDNQTEVQLPETLFGCTTEAKGENITGFVGVFGLSMGHLSLISQLGSSVDYKFSYCLPSFPMTDDDGENASGRLDFGSMAKVFDSGAASTPIISNDNFFYYLNLESISVNGGKHIIIKPSKDENQGNIIIDSGTTITYIDGEAVVTLALAVARVIRLPLSNHTNLDAEVGLICYNSSSSSSFEYMSQLAVSFHFADGLTVVLKSENALVGVAQDKICLSIAPNIETGSISIFGYLSQLNHHVGYDLSSKKVTMATADCSKP